MKLGSITLKPEQAEAVGRMTSGSLLVAGVGSGKTFMAIFWAQQYHKKIYVITTAAKRDKLAPGHKKPDWQESLEACGIYDYTVDSWNNIKKYEQVQQSVFVFDEAMNTGNGVWAKTFIKLAKKNEWVVATATPGDDFINYVPVFLAHGFYRNRTEFNDRHVEYDRFAKYPKIKQIHGTALLEKYRKQITVTVHVPRNTKRHKYYIITDFDYELQKELDTTRWNPYTEAPIETASEYTQVQRRFLAVHNDRKLKAKQIMKGTPRLIVWYNYTYEYDILVNICESIGKEYASWNGKHHDNIPESKSWIYLVQYNANAAWECITTDSMMFYSPNYSWRVTEQCEGRIDRMNNTYMDLHYYYLHSKGKVDKAVMKANTLRKQFNETTWGSQMLFK